MHLGSGELFNPPIQNIQWVLWYKTLSAFVKVQYIYNES